MQHVYNEISAENNLNLHLHTDCLPKFYFRQDFGNIGGGNLRKGCESKGAKHVKILVMILTEITNVSMHRDQVLALKIIKNVDKYREAAKLEVSTCKKRKNCKVTIFAEFGFSGQCAGKTARKGSSGKTVSC